MIRIKVEPGLKYDNIMFSEEAEYRKAIKDEYVLESDMSIRQIEVSRTLTSCIVLKPIRWKANPGETYYFIEFNSKGKLSLSEAKHMGWVIDDERYNSHNYFKTKDECKYKLDMIQSYINEVLNSDYIN